VEKHFVTFLSPGTFVSEETTRPIETWDVEKAVEMSHGILERHGAKPYGFYFSTRSRGPDDLDSKQTAKSNFYYLGGRIETKEEVFARNDPKESVLRLNMETMDIDRVIVNDNSWRFTGLPRDSDVVLPYEPRKEPS
jgi:hypothetical protein